jgi:site-specific recombinase XerD
MVVLRADKRKKGYSLYLDIYYNGERKTERLKLYVQKDYTKPLKDKNGQLLLDKSGKPKKHRILQEDKTIWELASAMKIEQQNQLNHKGTSFIHQLSEDKNFISYFEEKLASKNNNNSYIYAQKALVNFIGDKLLFSQVTLSFLDKFKTHLLTQPTLQSNTAKIYLERFKIIWDLAGKEGITQKNPFNGFAFPKKMKSEKTYLQLEDVKKIALVQFEKPIQEQIRQAFIFSCFTGIRRSDIIRIKWSDLSEDFRFIKFRQKKSAKEVLTIPLHSTAKKILQNLERRGDNIFHLLTDSTIGAYTKEISKKANLNKPISYHVARHSCATILYEHGVDLYTISKILGHSNIDITKIYTHLREDKKEEAINKIPEIEIVL